MVSRYTLLYAASERTVKTYTFILLIKLLSLIHLCHLRFILYALESSLLVQIQHFLTCIHRDFTKCFVVEIWFKVLEKSWKSIGRHVCEACLNLADNDFCSLVLNPQFQPFWPQAQKGDVAVVLISFRRYRVRLVFAGDVRPASLYG